MKTSEKCCERHRLETNKAFSRPKTDHRSRLIFLHPTFRLQVFEQLPVVDGRRGADQTIAAPEDLDLIMKLIKKEPRAGGFRKLETLPYLVFPAFGDFQMASPITPFFQTC